jgi:hypothetical protein
MASLKLGGLAVRESCSSLPPPYSARMEEDESCRPNPNPSPLSGKDIVMGDVVQDRRKRQDEKTKLLMVS